MDVEVWRMFEVKAKALVHSYMIGPTTAYSPTPSHMMRKQRVTIECK